VRARAACRAPSLVERRFDPRNKSDIEKRFDSAARPLGYRDTTTSLALLPRFFSALRTRVDYPGTQTGEGERPASRDISSRVTRAGRLSRRVFPRRLLIIRRITGAPIFIACL